MSLDKCDTIEKQVDYLRKDVDDFKTAYIKNGKELVRMAVVLERVEKILENEVRLDTEQEDKIVAMTEKLPILDKLFEQNAEMYRVFERGHWISKILWAGITSGIAITAFEFFKRILN